MEGKPTLYEYRERAPWWRELGCTEDELRSVPLHERATPDEDFLPVPRLSGPQGRSLYVHRRDLPDWLWQRLSAVLSRHQAPSGYEQKGILSGSQKQVTDWDQHAR